MSEAILPFKEAMKAAEEAKTMPEFRASMDDCTRRLKAANSALAVDSVYQIMATLTTSMERASGH